ncbi:MAG: type II secretion system F family protein [Candidatus Levybacteria bacterium]|nr:type II secretion system F family protein [Candidatus Levybacteria bacterium]
MRLRYKAISKENKVIQGLVDANDITEAASYLRQKELVPIRITKNTENSMLKILPFVSKLKSSDLILFTRQLASMISSGLTLVRSLSILREQLKNEAMVEVVGSIVADIEEGKTFSESLTKFPDFFSPVYVSIIKASETSGLMDKALERLADNLEKQEKLKSTIKAALVYPAIIVLMMIGVVIIMMTVVIPQLKNLYVSLNVSLPLPTQIVIVMSNITIAFWPFILGLGALGIFLYNRWYKTETGRLVIDNLMLKMPIFGNLVVKVTLAEASRTLGLLIGSGSLVVDSLLQTADTIGNIYYKNAIKDVAKRVENGIKIGDAMETYTLFPPLLVQLVKVGEETGKIDETLAKASEYFERESDQILRTLTTALEPFIMVVLGAGVAFLLISVITPIYSIITEIK